ncbi:MAG: response regulator [Chitinophagaceae bacterium]
MNNSDKKILIIDDDARNIFALKAVLRSRNFICISAMDVEEAFKLLATDNNIHIVLLDMMLPGLDGYEAIPAIRKSRGYEDVPIIAVTAQAMAGDREKCLRAGANAYISKPVDVDELKRVLDIYFK